MIYIAVLVFILGYLFITLESKLHINKSAFALAMGGILWTIVALYDPHVVSHHLSEAGNEIFNLVIFLLAAMSLVEILVHYRVFDVIRAKILGKTTSDRTQFVIITAVAFVLSAVVDNLTATIVMIQISRKFFKGENLLIAATGVAIAANAGGAFSPIGDITTIMLWLAHKFEASQIIIQGILPSIALYGTMIALMKPKIEESGYDELNDHMVHKLSRGEKIITFSVIVSFLLPVIAKNIGLPPVLGILLGLGITWIVVDLMRSMSNSHSHLTASIEHLMQKSDIGSIKFFIGILLAVSALNALGILEYVSSVVYAGGAESTGVIIGGNIFLGLISSVLDNIPLTAIAIDILPNVAPSLWVLLAISVGTGGSLLAIGSAAGVVAMGMVKELTFEKYFKYGFVPALVGFFVAIAVWGAQYVLFLA